MPQKFEHGEISFILYVINRNLLYDEYVPANVTVEFSSSYNSDDISICYCPTIYECSKKCKRLLMDFRVAITK